MRRLPEASPARFRGSNGVLTREMRPKRFGRCCIVQADDASSGLAFAGVSWELRGIVEPSLFTSLGSTSDLVIIARYHEEWSLERL